MRRIYLLLGTIFLSTNLHAEVYSFTIPAKEMVIAFNSPELSTFEGKSNKSAMQFKAQGFEGFNLSFFVEPASGKGSNSKECFMFYWNDAKKNPMIDKESIKFRSLENMSIVEYDLVGEWKGKSFRMPNRNFYLHSKSNCIDIHISKLPFDASDGQLLNIFENSIKIK